MANTNIRTLREMAGFTQEELARKLKMSTTSYNQIERGMKKVKPEQKAFFVHLFGVHPLCLEGSASMITIFNSTYTTAHYQLWHKMPRSKRIEAMHNQLVQEVQSCTSYTRLVALQLVVTTEYNRTQQ